MKFTYLIFSIIFLSLINVNAQEKKSEWELAKSENNIDISYRWLQIPQKHKVREMKVEFTVESEISSVLKQFTNSSNLKKWQSSVDECKISDVTGNQWLTYLSFDLPWPLKSKDLVTQNEFIKTDKYSLIRMTSMPNAKPLYKNKNRINSLESEWKFISLKNGNTKVVYTTLTYDKPEFPRSITDPIIQKKLIQSISLLKKNVS